MKHLSGVLLAFCMVLGASLMPVVAQAQAKWSELTPARQEALSPLGPQWEKLSTNQRKKWVGIADRLPQMKAEEQKRLKTNMATWAKLTPEQRRQARENYQKMREVPKDQKQALHKEYQKLPEKKKQELAKGAEKDSAKGTRKAKAPDQPLAKSGGTVAPVQR